MKMYICFLTLISSCLALPSPLVIPEGLAGKYIGVEPISSHSGDVPASGRIIGGNEVVPNSVPYQVALLLNGDGVCGGSLISNNYVLSAAHCTLNVSFVVLVFGAHNIQTTEPTQVRITSTSIINHPQYDPSTVNNDISLVRLPNSVSTNSIIQIIPLAASTAGTFLGSTAYVTGWGITSSTATSISPVLRGVNVTVISNAECSIPFKPNVVVASTLCTSGAGIVGVCQSDSGGPLVVNGVQVGVTSFLSWRGCEAGDPNGFARISAFRNWIAQNSDVPFL